MIQDNILVPVYSTELITKLDKQYPHRCPDVSMSDREIWIAVGRRQLIDTLQTHLMMDEEVNTLTGE